MNEGVSAGPYSRITVQIRICVRTACDNWNKSCTDAVSMGDAVADPVGIGSVPVEIEQTLTQFWHCDESGS